MLVLSKMISTEEAASEFTDMYRSMQYDENLGKQLVISRCKHGLTYRSDIW